MLSRLDGFMKWRYPEMRVEGDGETYYDKPPVFITNCAICNIELRLLKDSTEGQKVYCGQCWSKKEE